MILDLVFIYRYCMFFFFVSNALAERSTSVPDLRATEEEPLVVGATKLVVKRGSVLRERVRVANIRL